VLTEFGVSMELVRLIKMCLNETYINVGIGKHMHDNFRYCFLNLHWNMRLGRSKKTKWDEN
jgi:hypothetical protein